MFVVSFIKFQRGFVRCTGVGQQIYCLSPIVTAMRTMMVLAVLYALISFNPDKLKVCFWRFPRSFADVGDGSCISPAIGVQPPTETETSVQHVVSG